jgi:L-alanine-DL-glutamate epimerase-like enolase superfamily enzyme
MGGGQMDISFQVFDLRLRVPFTISRGTQTVAENVRVCLTDGPYEGIGEAAPNEHYGELRDTVLAYLEHFRPILAELADPTSRNSAAFPISALHTHMDQLARHNPAAKAAIDMAAYDLLGRRLNTPIYELLGLDPAAAPRTSFTIGIDTPDGMANKAIEASHYPILKVKVGTPHDGANLEAIRRVRADAVIRVDANEAWTAKEAVERIKRLSVYDLELVEQPVESSDLEGLGMVKQHTSLPIFADESCIVPADIPRVAPYVDGINIKLMKCGGIYPALQMIQVARAHRLQIMMGCMIESSLAITAAAHLSPLIDYADLDGHLLIADDPFTGVRVTDGKLNLPDGPGLGVRPSR